MKSFSTRTVLGLRLMLLIGLVGIGLLVLGVAMNLGRTVGKVGYAYLFHTTHVTVPFVDPNAINQTAVTPDPMPALDARQFQTPTSEAAQQGTFDPNTSVPSTSAPAPSAPQRAVAYLRTPDGVFIELTDQAQQCADGSWYFYVAASDATTINTGCWTYRAPFVLTQDRSGTIYQYPQENFVRTSVAFDELLR